MMKWSLRFWLNGQIGLLSLDTEEGKHMHKYYSVQTSALRIELKALSHASVDECLQLTRDRA